MTFKISPNPERVHYFINLEGGERGSGQLTEAAHGPATPPKGPLLLTQHFTADAAGLPVLAALLTFSLARTE